MQEMQGWFLGREDPLEEEMATHSRVLAWRTPWTNEPSMLQSMWLQRVRHKWATEHTHTKVLMQQKWVPREPVTLAQVICLCFKDLLESNLVYNAS